MRHPFDPSKEHRLCHDRFESDADKRFNMRKRWDKENRDFNAEKSKKRKEWDQENKETADELARKRREWEEENRAGETAKYRQREEWNKENTRDANKRFEGKGAAKRPTRPPEWNKQNRSRPFQRKEGAIGTPRPPEWTPGNKQNTEELARWKMEAEKQVKDMLRKMKAVMEQLRNFGSENKKEEKEE